MNKLKLSASYFFGIEPYNRGLRLIVFDGDAEWVCHTIKVNDLRSFLQAETAHLFKGRLQLDKLGNDIIISVKNNKAGTVNTADLDQLINTHTPFIL